MDLSISGTRPAPSAAPAWKRRWSLAQDLLLIGVSVFFFWAHASHAVNAHSAANLFFAVEQGLLVGVFLTRRRTDTTSTRPWDWFVATIGGWLALAMRPYASGGMMETYGSALQVVGLSAVIVGFATIGKSFGVVAANRGLKVGGPYRFVRHPIYMAHSITLVGFTVANLWWYNVAILVTVTIFQVFRIHAEERVLAATADYDAYRARVRWRLVPGLF